MATRTSRIATTKSPRRTPLKISLSDWEQAILACDRYLETDHFPGVYYYPRKKTPKWRALITYKGKKIHLGMFSTLEQAKRRILEFRRTQED